MKQHVRRGVMVASFVLPMMGMTHAATPVDIQAQQETLQVAKQTEQARQGRLQSSRIQTKDIVTTTSEGTKQEAVKFHIDRIILEGDTESF